MKFKKFFKSKKQQVIKFVKKEPLLSATLVFTAILAIFFRTYSYFERIYIYSDHALFTQAAFYAKENFLLPQIGPFAQAPFFTGPWWLWALEIFYLFPFGLLAPWYFMSFFSFVFIVLIYFVGKEIGGKWLGAIAALFAAISTAQIDNSFSTWNAALDPYVGLLAIYLLLKYVKTPKPNYAFLLGFIISVGTVVHFQVMLTAPIALVALLFTKPKIKNIAALIAGGVIPLLPFLYFDLRFNWFETGRIYDYVTIAQYRIYVPNRWLTYAGVYWPGAWASIIGGKMWLGGTLIALVSALTLMRLIRFKSYKNYYLVAIAFAFSVIMFRYFRGERFFYFTNYAHAFVILLSAWATVEVFKFKKYLGAALLAAIVFFTIEQSIENLKPRVITYPQVNALVNEIYNTYPNQNFDIYECPFNGSLISHAASLKMYYDKRNSLDGVKIGVCNQSNQLSWRVVAQEETVQEYGYKHKSTPNIYKEMTEWWKQNPPK